MHHYIYDWKPIALGATLTLLALGVVWAFCSIVRAIKGKFLEYRTLRVDVEQLKRSVHVVNARVNDVEFKSHTASIPVIVKPPEPKASESGVHPRVITDPPPLPQTLEVAAHELEEGWEDDEDKTTSRNR